MVVRAPTREITQSLTHNTRTSTTELCSRIVYPETMCAERERTKWVDWVSFLRNIYVYICVFLQVLNACEGEEEKEEEGRGGEGRREEARGRTPNERADQTNRRNHA